MDGWYFTQVEDHWRGSVLYFLAENCSAGETTSGASIQDCEATRLLTLMREIYAYCIGDHLLCTTFKFPAQA